MRFEFKTSWSSQSLDKMYKTLIVLFALAGCCIASVARKSKFVQPCKPLTAQCVRDNLAANSKCSKNGLGSIPNEYKIPSFRFEAPYFNATYIDHDLVIKNHDKCHVSEFFYNLESDVAVLTLDCPWLRLSSNRTYIQHASGLEDARFSFSSTWEYPLIRLTANIQRANEMNICNSFVFTDVTALGNFIISPNDIPTQEYLSTDLSFLNIYERESFFYRGPQLFRNYISTSICNFNCYQ